MVKKIAVEYLNSEIDQTKSSKPVSLKSPSSGQVTQLAKELSPKILNESPQIFRLLVEQVKDYAIFMLNPEGIILSWNEGASRIKGYDASEIVGKHFSIFYPPADIENCKPQNELRIAIETGRYEEEGWRVRKDGSRFWASVVISPVSPR